MRYSLQKLYNQTKENEAKAKKKSDDRKKLKDDYGFLFHWGQQLAFASMRRKLAKILNEVSVDAEGRLRSE